MSHSPARRNSFSVENTNENENSRKPSPFSVNIGQNEERSFGFGLVRSKTSYILRNHNHYDNHITNGKKIGCGKGKTRPKLGQNCFDKKRKSNFKSPNILQLSSPARARKYESNNGRQTPKSQKLNRINKHNNKINSKGSKVSFSKIESTFKFDTSNKNNNENNENNENVNSANMLLRSNCNYNNNNNMNDNSNNNNNTKKKNGKLNLVKSKTDSDIIMKDSASSLSFLKNVKNRENNNENVNGKRVDCNANNQNGHRGESYHDGMFVGFSRQSSLNGNRLLDRFIPLRNESNLTNSFILNENNGNVNGENEISPTSDIFGKKIPGQYEERMKWIHQTNAHRQFSQMMKDELLVNSNSNNNNNNKTPHHNSSNNNVNNNSEEDKVSPLTEIETIIESYKQSHNKLKNKNDYIYSNNNSTKYFTDYGNKNKNQNDRINKYKFKLLSLEDSDASQISSSNGNNSKKSMASSNDSLTIVQFKQHLMSQKKSSDMKESPTRVLTFTTPQIKHGPIHENFQIPTAITSIKSKSSSNLRGIAGNGARSHITPKNLNGTTLLFGSTVRQPQGNVNGREGRLSLVAQGDESARSEKSGLTWLSQKREENEQDCESLINFRRNPLSLKTQLSMSQLSSKLARKVGLNSMGRRLDGYNLDFNFNDEDNIVEPYKCIHVGAIKDDFYSCGIDWNHETNLIAYGLTDCVQLYNCNNVRNDVNDDGDDDAIKDFVDLEDARAASLTFSPSGEYLGIGTNDGYYSIYDVEYGKCLLWRNYPENHIGVMEWSKHWNNHCLVIGSKQSKHIWFHDLRCKLKFNLCQIDNSNSNNYNNSRRRSNSNNSMSMFGSTSLQSYQSNNSSMFKNAFQSLNFEKNCIYANGSMMNSNNNNNNNINNCKHTRGVGDSKDTRILDVDANVVSFKWSYDGYHFAIGSRLRNVSIWDIRYLCRSSQYILNNHEASIRAVAWSPHDYNIIATGGGQKDMKICLWNLAKPHSIDNHDNYNNNSNNNNGNSSKNWNMVSDGYNVTLNKPIMYFNGGSQICNLIFDMNNKDRLLSTHGYCNDNRDDIVDSRCGMILWNLNDKYNKTSKTEKMAIKIKQFKKLKNVPNGKREYRRYLRKERSKERSSFCALSPNYNDVVILSDQQLTFWNVFGHDNEIDNNNNNNNNNCSDIHSMNKKGANLLWNDDDDDDDDDSNNNNNNNNNDGNGYLKGKFGNNDERERQSENGKDEDDSDNEKNEKQNDDSVMKSLAAKAMKCYTMNNNAKCSSIIR